MSDSPSETTPSPLQAAKHALYQLMNSVATKEQVIAALGMVDHLEQTDEFWDAAFRTVRKRFLLLCLATLGRDLATEWDDLTLGELCALVAQAQAYAAAPGFGYTYIRNWFIYRGQFEYSCAIKLRRERNLLAARCGRILCIMEPSGAKYLAYGDGLGDPVLVNGPALAHKFPIHSLSQCEPEYAKEMAEHFVRIKDRFPDIKEIKFLVGAQSKTNG
jgi:hypothetical protein